MAGDVQAPKIDAKDTAPAAPAANQQSKDAKPALGPATGEKKLSGAELKAKAKAEKAARRAATKAVSQPAGDAKGGKSKQKQDGPQGVAGKGKPGGTGPRAPPKEKGPKVPECFSHLAMAKRISMTQADKDVHPAVLLLGQQMSAFVVTGSTRRMESTLLALKKVRAASFSRHKTPPTPCACGITD